MSLLVERRRPGLAPDLLMRVGLAWAMICALLLVTNMREIASLQYPHPEDLLRLAQVRGLVAGGGWFAAAADGSAVHLSRLVDVPLVAVILALKPIFGQPAAEGLAAVIVPLIALGCALLLAARIAWRVIGDEAAGLACLAMALSVPVIADLRPLRIDGAGWQLVLALAAANGLMARNPRVGGRVVGAALAAWLAISLAALPLAAAMCSVAALRWVRRRQDAAWLTTTLQALAATSTGLFVGAHGFAAMAPLCGSVSPVHLAIFIAAAMLTTGLAAFEPLPRAALLAGLAVIAALGAATYFAVMPACAPGAAGGLPLWRQSPALAAQIAVPPAVGLYACLQLAGRSREWLRCWWLEYALLLAAALVLAVLDGRTAGFAGALGAVPLGWRIREWIRSARTARRTGRRFATLAAIAIALLPALPLNLLTFALPAEAASAR
ncbi:MAG: hypothetical protein ACTHKM_11965 [Tsuneonella sp.]